MVMDLMRKHPDSPPVMIHPPILFGVGFFAGLALDIWLGLSFGVGEMTKIGYLFIAAGFALIGWCVWHLRAADTNVPTNLPTTALVTTGPYKNTRNPIYIALTVAFLGMASLLDAPLAMLALIPILVILHVGVVVREERYLLEKFGEAYEEYVARTKRYF